MALAIYNPRSLTENEVDGLYWEGGLVRKGHAPHEILADCLSPVMDKFILPELFAFLSPASQKVVRSILMLYAREESMLSKLPRELFADIMLSSVFSVINFAWSQDFDQNGVLYAIGHEAAREASLAQGADEQWINEQWINPASAGKVEVVCSSNKECSINVVCGRQGGRGSTKPVPNSWVGIDLQLSHMFLSCTAYTFSCSKFGEPRALRHWEFQGSVDGVQWTLLRKHVNDCSIPDQAGASATFNVDCQGRFFRMFRIVQTGPSSYRLTHGYIEDNVSQLTFGNLELYGVAIIEDGSALSKHTQ